MNIQQKINAFLGKFLKHIQRLLQLMEFYQKFSMEKNQLWLRMRERGERRMVKNIQYRLACRRHVLCLYWVVSVQTGVKKVRDSTDPVAYLIPYYTPPFLSCFEECATQTIYFWHLKTECTHRNCISSRQSVEQCVSVRRKRNL